VYHTTIDVQLPVQEVAQLGEATMLTREAAAISKMVASIKAEQHINHGSQSHHVPRRRRADNSLSSGMDHPLKI
jgi:hypothetical protein